MKDQLRKVPQKPGVYMFKGAKGNILYIGKARDLKRRMLSYFQKTHRGNPKIEVMVEKVAGFDFFVTKNELEALILEYNLIKQHRPPFNSSLRDDKSYPYLAVTYEEDFPRLYVTRELHRKGVKYFGPYTKVYALRKTLDTLRSIFPVRTYTRTRPTRPSSRPYFDYHIKWGIRPGTEAIDSATYRKIIDSVIDFLEGRNKVILGELEREMKRAAAREDFERAARLRDRIQAARYVLEDQRMVMRAPRNEDVIGIDQEGDEVYARVLFVRSGRLIGSRGYIVEREPVEEDALTALVKQFYAEADYIPPEILLPQPIEDREVIESWLAGKRGHKVKLAVPRRGEKRELIEMAAGNAKYAYQFYRLKTRARAERGEVLLEKLKSELKLAVLPERIEAFDISTLQGKETVGSMVVFEGGEPKKADYRKFRIKWIEGQDDFASMVEVLKRRLKYLTEPIPDERFASRPDLLVVDGGKPQLSAALKAMEDLEIAGLPVIALAKREEEIYMPARPDPIRLSRKSPALNLLKRVRDEAHRFAVTYHRTLRTKDMLL